MPTYQAPVRDIEFLLNDVFEIGKYQNLPRFSEATPDLVSAILEEGAKIAQEVLHPLNRTGDEEGCHFEDGEVTTPKGFKEAYETFTEGGWAGLTADPEYGGQGLPNILGVAFLEMISAANISFGTYPGLARGTYAAIHKHGNDEQKATYLPRLANGEWGGTMNLTEPHSGTDLGLMRTRAEPQEDGSYKITGTKIFITAGEHDLTDNIVHLVLARLPDAPEGVRGISMFLVPKFLVNEDGSLGARNTASCGSIESKMGLKASATCVMNFDDAIGHLIGGKNKGLRAMFTMMNEARLGVGVQGLGLSEVAYQNARDYARERRQGRSLKGPAEPDEAADPIIVHPDVRKMLLTVRAFNEGARALALWMALNADLAEIHPDDDARRVADDLVSLFMPVLKAHLTDTGFESVNWALQCFGGHGYIRENGMEQFVRDARITQLYEGTSGIQALDLVGRKLPEHMGRLLRQFFHPVDRFLQDNRDDPALKDFVMPLAKSFARLQQATAWVAEQGLKDPEQAGAVAADYLKMFGLVALGFMWARMAKASSEKLSNGAGDGRQFLESKLHVGRYYMAKTLPETSSLLSRIVAGKEALMALEADAF